MEVQPKRTIFTYLIIAPGAPMGVTLSFGGEYPQRADLRSELQVALHSMVFCEQQSLALDQAGTMQIDQPQRALVCSAPSKEVWSSVADRLLVAESAVLFPSASESHCDAISTNARASFQSDTVHTWSEIQFTLERACTIEEAAMAVEQGVDICTNRETGKEYLCKTLTISDSSESSLDSPVVTDSLKDICVEATGRAVFTATVKNVTRVNCFCHGHLVKSAKRVQVFEHPRHILVSY